MSAAIGLIVEGGYPSLTMGGVAKRAGASKAALYRRWPNKRSLIIDAIEAFAHTHVPVPDTGHVRDDVAGYLHNFIQARRDYADTLAAISDALTSEPELAGRCRGTLQASFSANVEAIVGRGVGRGELPGNTDVELLASVVPALIRFWRQSTGQPLDEALIERIAEQFFNPTTASPPSWAPAAPPPRPEALFEPEAGTHTRDLCTKGLVMPEIIPPCCHE
jgi:AcrR family transcriptional regulator